MSFRILQQQFHSTALCAKRYFQRHYGATNFAIEMPIDPAVAFIPTLTARLADHHILAVEVRGTVYAHTLDQVILGCRNHGLPVKFFVAIPNECGDREFQANLKIAQANGVGIIEVDATHDTCTILRSPLALSLNGIRRIDPQQFPKKYRGDLAGAQETFLNGNPAKGCSDVYDIIEAVIRKLAKKTAGNRMFANPPAAANIETDNWATLTEALRARIQYGQIQQSCPEVKPNLFNRILAVTPYRNETGHKPRDKKTLMKRDAEMRTRFESACDLLRDLLEILKPLHL